MQVNKGILFILVPAVAVLAIVGTRMVDRPGQPTAPAGVAGSEQLQALEQRIDELASRLDQGGQELDPATEIANLREEIAMLKQENGGKDEAHDSTGEGGTSSLVKLLTDPEIREKLERFSQQQRHTQLAFLDQTFDTESVDHEWATEASRKIEATFTTPEIARSGQLVSVDCRTTLCRVVIDFDPGAAQGEGTDPATARFEFENNLLASLTENMPIALSNESEPNGLGGYRYNITLVRKGFVMPKSPDVINTQGVTAAEAVEYLENLE